jgi:hypothetical protein
MADLSNFSALGLKIETTPNTFNAPSSSSDLVQCANLKVAINTLSTEIKEYVGTIHAPGPVVLGKTIDVSGTIYLRGPGSSTPPTSDSLPWTRILRAAAFAEVIQSSAIPAAPEAGSAGTTTALTLGASAAGTADLYRGLIVSIQSLAATAVKQLTMIRSYTAAKVAALAETALSALSTSNYQIPKQLAYQLSPGTPPTLSVSVWMGSRRIDCSGMAISSFKLNLPAAGRSNLALPSIDFTLTGNFYGDADDTAPTITLGGAIPPFRDGKLWVGGIQMPGTSLAIDLNATVAFPPNPNQPSGNDAALLASTKRVAALKLNQVTKATVDFMALADAQGKQPILAMYGAVTGNIFGVIVTDARLAYRNPDTSGEFVATDGDAYIDGYSKDITIAIPFF